MRQRNLSWLHLRMLHKACWREAQQQVAYLATTSMLAAKQHTWPHGCSTTSGVKSTDRQLSSVHLACQRASVAFAVKRCFSLMLQAIMSPKEVEARRVARDAGKAEFTAKGVQVSS